MHVFNPSDVPGEPPDWVRVLRRPVRQRLVLDAIQRSKQHAASAAQAINDDFLSVH